MSASSTVRTASGAGVGPDALAAADIALDDVVSGLAGAPADLVVVFVGAAYAGEADAIRARVAERVAPGVLVGVSAQGVVSGGGELEDTASLALWAAHLPGAELTPLRYPPPGEAQASLWPEPPPDAAGLILFADPHSTPTGALLAWMGRARPGLPVSGGLASGAAAPGEARLPLDDAVHVDGAVGVALGGGVRLRHLVSQGCRPVGPPLVVTRGERNVIAELAGVPAAERIREIFEAAGPEDQALLRIGLHIGLVIDEYADEHDHGNFLVRGVLGAEPSSGAIAIGDRVRVGQVVRLHVRDARSADEDLRAVLDRLPEPTAGRAAGALLFTCNGRGRRLFGVPDHDAGLLSEHLRGAPVAGFFAAGELGPVGAGSHLHGFTVSAVVVDSAAGV